MKTLITYKTKGGATKKYMEWLAKDLDADIMTYDQVGRKFDFDKYNTIIVSSGTYMGLMPLNRFLKKNWKKLKGKQVIAIAVGAAPADDKWSKWSYERISHKIRDNIQYFKILGEIPVPAGEEKKPTQVKKENLNEVLHYIKGVK